MLYTHGDTFDDFVVKPYHGVQWLENTGTYPYTAHTLATTFVRNDGGGRFTLWTGDPGTALYLADCLAGRGAFPVP